MNKNPNENKDNVVPNPNGENQENNAPKQERFVKRWLRRTWKYAAGAAVGAAGAVAFMTVVNARKAECEGDESNTEETDESENSEVEEIPEF